MSSKSHVFFTPRAYLNLDYAHLKYCMWLVMSLFHIQISDANFASYLTSIIFLVQNPISEPTLHLVVGDYQGMPPQIMLLWQLRINKYRRSSLPSLYLSKNGA